MKELIEEKLTREIIGSAIEVHKHWGPGLLEDIYEKSLCKELTLRKIPFENQLCIPLLYKGEKVGEDLRVDILADRKVVIEIKAVSSLAPIHEAQVITYMKILKCRVGLLMNFNVPILVDGIKRIVL